MVGSRHDTDRGTTDTTSAMRAHRRVEQIEGVDQDEGCLECAIRAVEMKLDGLITGGVQGHERRRRLGRKGVVEPAGDQHDPAIEEPLLQPC